MIRKASSWVRWQLAIRMAVVASLFAAYGSVASADPFTDNFDALITELEIRSETLTNTTDKAEAKQKKAVDKVLKTLNDKDSTSVATDIKNAGKVSKSLQKAFPDEFLVVPTANVPTVNGGFITSLGDLVAAVFELFASDVQADLDALQTQLDGLPDNDCKDEVQEEIDAVQAILDTEVLSPFDPIIPKLLGAAIKGLSKIADGIESVSNCGGGGGGGGGDAMMTAQISLNGGAAADFEGGAAGVYVPNTGQLSVQGTSAGGLPIRSITISALNVTGPGVYPAGVGTLFLENPGSMDQFTFATGITGMLNLTSFNLQAQTAEGTFYFSASQTVPAGDGTVEITSGSFTIDTIAQP